MPNSAQNKKLKVFSHKERLIKHRLYEVNQLLYHGSFQLISIKSCIFIRQAELFYCKYYYSSVYMFTSS